MKKTVLILLLLSIAPLSIFANAHDCEPNAPIGRACRYRSGDHDPHGMVKTGKCAEDKKGNKKYVDWDRMNMVRVEQWDDYGKQSNRYCEVNK